MTIGEIQDDLKSATENIRGAIVALNIGHTQSAVLTLLNAQHTLQETTKELLSRLQPSEK